MAAEAVTLDAVTLDEELVVDTEAVVDEDGLRELPSAPTALRKLLIIVYVFGA